MSTQRKFLVDVSEYLQGAEVALQAAHDALTGLPVFEALPLLNDVRNAMAFVASARVETRNQLDNV